MSMTATEWLQRVATLPPVARRLAISLVAFNPDSEIDGPTRLALQAHALDVQPAVLTPDAPSCIVAPDG